MFDGITPVGANLVFALCRSRGDKGEHKVHPYKAQSVGANLVFALLQSRGRGNVGVNLVFTHFARAIDNDAARPSPL